MIYSISLSNIRYGHLMPQEDSLAFDDNIFAVADGITRDPSEDMDFTKKSFIEILKDYPNPSGAKLAADTFCAAFIQSIKAGANIKAAFINANNEIAELNRKHIKKVDYLMNDFYGCVASGGVIKGSVLYWGVIGDCGVMVYSKDGQINLKTPNSVVVFNRYVRIGKIKFKWEHAEGRKFVRTQYRNRADQMIDGVCVSYGALTGEKKTEPFIYTGEYKFNEGDLIVFYSDGFEETVKHKDFFKTIYNQKRDMVEKNLLAFTETLSREDYEKYGKERTLIIKI